MIHLFGSNRLERLAGELGDRPGSQGADVFVPDVVIVQSRGMERWLKLRIAEKKGIAANIECPFPKSFIMKTLRNTVGLHDMDAFRPDVMTWRIYGILAGFQGKTGPLADYITGENADIARFDLAVRLAGLFDDYMIFRPDMMLDWAGEKAGFNGIIPELPTDDEWQKTLWNQVADGHTDSLFINSLKDFMSADIARFDLPARVHLFGISSLPPLYMLFFQKLALTIDVNIYSLNPSRQFWDECVNEKRMLKEVLKEGDIGYWEVGNPLLSSMGMLSRDFSRIIHGLDDVEAEDNLFVPSENDTMLASIQNTMLDLKNPLDAPESHTPAKEDHSISIEVCHSPMREVEVLYDRLLAMLDADKDLNPRDILVMTPDIQKHAPYIQAVFGNPEKGLQRLPFSIADRAVGAENPVATALLRILRLPDTRLTVIDVLDILEIQAVYARFGLDEADLDLVRSWIESGGIRWGLDAGFRQQSVKVGFNENSWEFGIRRLLLGYSMPEESGVFNDILPVDVDPREAEVLGRFLAFTDQLFATTRELSNGARKKEDWREIIQGMLNGDHAFFAKDQDTAMRLLSVTRAVSQVFDAMDKADGVQELPLDVMIAAFDEVLGQEAESHGFLHGGITFARLRPMRSIPARVICMIGMDDGAFPRQEHRPEFDLIARKPAIGDRNPRYDDRNLFMEAMISARDALYISYTGRNIRDNSDMPPSVLVSELLDYLRGVYGTEIDKKIITKHPLQAFSPEYFDPNRPDSYSVANLNGARAMSDKKQGNDAGRGKAVTTTQASDDEVLIYSLLKFLKAPVKYYFQHHLSVFLETDDIWVPETDEPMDTVEGDYFKKTEVIDEFLKRGGDQSPESDTKSDLITRLRASGRLPVGDVGLDAARDYVDRLAEFAATVKAEFKGDNQAVDVRVGLGQGRVLTGQVKYDAAGSQVVEYRYSKNKAGVMLTTWVSGLAVRATGYACEKAVCVFKGNDGTATTCRLEIPDEDEAKEILNDLISMYFDGLARPLSLFLKTSFAYTSAVFYNNHLQPGKNGKIKKKKDPVKEARKKWKPQDFIFSGKKIPSEGEDEYNSRAFSLDLFDRDSADLREFKELAIRVFEPVLDKEVP